MRVQMLGHAGLQCETVDAPFLMGPWIAGPPNFRAWRHLPELALGPVTLTGSELRQGRETPLRGSTVTRQVPRADPRARRAMPENECFVI